LIYSFLNKKFFIEYISIV